MKKSAHIIMNIVLSGLLIACLIWAAVAPRMQALIPAILAAPAAIGLIRLNTDWIETY